MFVHTIVGGFARGGESNSSRKRYDRQVLLLDDAPSSPTPRVEKKLEFEIVFSVKDVTRIHPHGNGHMVITV